MDVYPNLSNDPNLSDDIATFIVRSGNTKPYGQCSKQCVRHQKDVYNGFVSQIRSKEDNDNILWLMRNKNVKRVWIGRISIIASNTIYQLGWTENLVRCTLL